MSDKFPKSHSHAEIEDRTRCLRALLGVGDQAYFNIIELVENNLATRLSKFFVEVLSMKQMNALEAFISYGPPRISIREDVYEGAYRDEARSRFTIAHELGHLCLHWGYPRPRLPSTVVKERFRRSPAETRLETEANQFAGALLMPKAIVSKFSDARTLAKLCRVSALAASCRLNELFIHGDGLTTRTVQDLFGTSYSEK